MNKSVFIPFISLFMVSIIAVSCGTKSEYKKKSDGSLTWLSIDEAATLKNGDGKKYLIDVYTDWCGWCKKMDKETFTDPALVDFLDKNYHVVKFNAEQVAPIMWEGKEYIYQAGGRKGINLLAPQLLGGRLSYPSFAVLDANRKPIKIVVGYKQAQQMMEELSNI